MRLAGLFARLWDRRAARKAIALLSAEMQAELDRHSREASERLRDPYFMDGHTGHHVAKDELMALSYLRSIDIEPENSEDQALYLQRLSIAVTAAKNRFAAREDDPEGFGVSTFEEVLMWLERQQGHASGR